MTDPKKPKSSPGSGHSSRPGRLRPGEKRSIREELGELDFEADALLDSLLADPSSEPPSALPSSTAPTVPQKPPEPAATKPQSAPSAALPAPPPRPAGPPRPLSPSRPLGPPRPGPSRAATLPLQPGKASTAPEPRAPEPPAAAAAPPPPAPPAEEELSDADWPMDEIDDEVTAVLDASKLRSSAAPAPAPTQAAPVPVPVPVPVAPAAPAAPPEPVAAPAPPPPPVAPPVPVARAEPVASASPEILPESFRPPPSLGQSAPPEGGRSAAPPPEEAPELEVGEAEPASESLPGGLPDEIGPPARLSEDGTPLDPLSPEAFRARARFFEHEARSSDQPPTRARTLLVASELYALAGDPTEARRVAEAAAAASRPMGMAGRQLRWLAAAEGDNKTMSSVLEVETRSATTPEARVHAAYLAAEVQRFIVGDLAAARKKHDLVVHAQQEDPRGHVMKLADQLAATAAPPKLRWPDTPALEPLARATEELSRLRSAAPPGADTPLGAFEEARRALSLGHRAQAAESVKKLAEVQGIGAAATWLAASLLGPDPKTRPESIDLLRGLLAAGPDRAARRALARRALEQRDSEALTEALGRDPEAFSAADRLILTALSGAKLVGFETLVEEIAEGGQPVLAAAAVLAGPLKSKRPVVAGSPEEQAALELGRALSRGSSELGSDSTTLDQALQGLEALDQQVRLCRALRLERAVASGEASEVARRFSALSISEASPSAERDHALIEALLQELAGDAEAARAAHEKALEAQPAFQASVRALLDLSVSDRGAELLEELAGAETDGTRAALHFLEAGLRLRPDSEQNLDALLDKAAAADPKLVPVLGEHHAAQAGEVERRLHWLGVRRGTATDPLDRAITCVREARLLTDTDPEAARSLLNEALDARPGDLTLAELGERFLGGPDLDRGSWREAAAEKATGPTRARLFLEAALGHEGRGDAARALACARKAVESDGGPLAELTLRRMLAADPNEATRVRSELLERARASTDPAEQIALYQELSQLDDDTPDSEESLALDAALLEHAPGHLPALRRLERAYLGATRAEDLRRVEALLAEALAGPDASGAARLAARLSASFGDFDSVEQLAQITVEKEPDALWALRALSSQARASDDAEGVLTADRRLFELSTRPLDLVTLALRAAEAAVQLGRFDQAKSLLESALEIVPDHLVVLATLITVLERTEQWEEAARTLETLAEACNVDAHKVEAFSAAGTLYLDRVADPMRGREALEQALAIDSSHEPSLVRLQGVYVDQGERRKLAELLERRLEHTTDPEERIALEVARGRALAQIGEPGIAKAALADALDSNPDHVEALEALSELCSAEGDWSGAEQALIRLARHVPDPQRQVEVYRKLGELYDTSLPNPERAELAYQEVLKRAPNDRISTERLIEVFGKLGQPEKAVAAQTELLEHAQSPEEKRYETLRLADVIERIQGDHRLAETTLERALKTWPHDRIVLRSLYDFHRRGGQERAGQLLLDRASADARRALSTGRFEPGFFETLAAVAEMKGATESAAAIGATLGALSGQDLAVQGGGPAAGDPGLDDLTAPDHMGSALRRLLMLAGHRMDQAYPFDLRAVGATPLPPQAADYLDHVQRVADGFRLQGVEVYVAPRLGTVCLPISSSPPTIVFGQAALDMQDDAGRYSLLMRALKMVKTRTSVLSRTSPVDLWPVLAGFVATLSRGFLPQGVDARRFEDARARFEAVSQESLGDDVATLALEVVGEVGNGASQLGAAALKWGDRTALISVGSPLTVFRAIAYASGSDGLPEADAERLRFIVRSAEARDLAIFSASDGYVEARRRLGLQG